MASTSHAQEIIGRAALVQRGKAVQAQDSTNNSTAALPIEEVKKETQDSRISLPSSILIPSPGKLLIGQTFGYLNSKYSLSNLGSAKYDFKSEAGSSYTVVAYGLGRYFKFGLSADYATFNSTSSNNINSIKTITKGF